MIKGIWIDIGDEFGVRGNGLHLGCKNELVANKCEIERLHADAIARERQRAVPLVPDAECIITFDSRQKSLQAPFLVAMHKDFGVGMIGAKPMSGRYKLGPQTEVVIDFTIEGDDDASVLIRHGLIGRGADVDDCQPAVTQAYLSIV